MKELFRKFNKIIELFKYEIKGFTHNAYDFCEQREEGTENPKKNEAHEREIYN